MGKIDLRGATTKKPREMPKPAYIKGPGFEGTLPFMPAEVILTDVEKRQLKSVGWKEGDPIPNLTALVAEERERILSEPEEIPSHIKGLKKKPEVVSIDSLPPEGKERIKKILQKATQDLKKRVAPEDDIPDTLDTSIPGLVEALEVAKKATNTPDDGIIEPRIAESTNKTDVDAPIIAPAARCSHCGWAVDKIDNASPTKEDKLQFVASVLAQKRFVKSYDLLGGALTVEFRTLTSDENDLIVKQLVADWNKSRISGPAHSVQQALNYQQALSLQAIKTTAGPIKLETLNDYSADPPEDETIIPEVVEYITKTATPTESIRKIVSRTFVSFQELVAKMEVMAEAPDFWKATEG